MISASILHFFNVDAGYLHPWGMLLSLIALVLHDVNCMLFMNFFVHDVNCIFFMNYIFSSIGIILRSKRVMRMVLV